MQVKPYLDELEIEKLVALIFLIDQDKTADELKDLVTNNGFLELWRKDRIRIKKLIENYPDPEEEKHFLLAMLEAAHGYNQYSQETKDILDYFEPFIILLLQKIEG